MKTWEIIVLGLICLALLGFYIWFVYYIFDLNIVRKIKKPEKAPTNNPPEDEKPLYENINTTIKINYGESFNKSLEDLMITLHKCGETFKNLFETVGVTPPEENQNPQPSPRIEEDGVKEIAILKVRTNTTELEKEIYPKLIKKYGKQQIIVAIEELSELQKELCKHLRDQTNKKAIIEELCDVQIMLDQIILIFGISTLELSTVKGWKLERTKERMLA